MTCGLTSLQNCWPPITALSARARHSVHLPQANGRRTGGRRGSPVARYRSEVAMRRLAAACAFWLSIGAAACFGPQPSTPLGAAAWEGRAADARRLIAGGTPADSPDGSWTPLMYAARR